MKNMIDKIKLADSLKGLNASSVAGAAWTNEALKTLDKNSFSFKSIKYVLESAKQIKDESINTWCNEQASSLDAVAFEAALILESLQSGPAVFGATEGLVNALTDTLAVDDYQSIAGKIAVGNVLDKWRIVKPIGRLVQMAKHSYYKKQQAVAGQGSGANPIGLIYNSNDEVIVSFDGVIYKLVENNLVVAPSYPAEISSVVKALAKCASKYSVECDGFLWQSEETGIGAICINDSGLSLDGRIVSVEDFKSIAVEYYNLNKLSYRAKGIMKTLDMLMSCVPTLANNWELIGKFDNIITVKDDSVSRCYFVSYDNNRWAVIRAYKADAGVVSRVEIKNFDKIGQAINELPYSFVKIALADEYSEMISEETKADREKAAAISAKKAEIAKADNAIAYAQSSLDSLSENFVSEDLRAKLTDKISKLATIKDKLVDELAALA